jgi:hypothetical protein
MADVLVTCLSKLVSRHALYMAWELVLGKSSAPEKSLKSLASTDLSNQWHPSFLAIYMNQTGVRCIFGVT